MVRKNDLLFCFSMLSLVCVWHISAMEQVGMKIVTMADLVRVALYGKKCTPKEFGDFVEQSDMFVSVNCKGYKVPPALQEGRMGLYRGQRALYWGNSDEDGVGIFFKKPEEKKGAKRGCCRRFSAWWYQEKGAVKKQSLGEKLNDLWG